MCNYYILKHNPDVLNNENRNRRTFKMASKKLTIVNSFKNINDLQKFINNKYSLFSNYLNKAIKNKYFVHNKDVYIVGEKNEILPNIFLWTIKSSDGIVKYFNKVTEVSNYLNANYQTVRHRFNFSNGDACYDGYYYKRGDGTFPIPNTGKNIILYDYETDEEMRFKNLETLSEYINVSKQALRNNSHRCTQTIYKNRYQVLIGDGVINKVDNILSYEFNVESRHVAVVIFNKSALAIFKNLKMVTNIIYPQTDISEVSKYNRIRNNFKDYKLIKTDVGKFEIMSYNKYIMKYDNPINKDILIKRLNENNTEFIKIKY